MILSSRSHAAPSACRPSEHLWQCKAKAKGREQGKSRAPDFFAENTPTAVLVRQVPGAIAQFEKRSLVAKLKRPAIEKGPSAESAVAINHTFEARPDVVALAKQLQAGMSLRKISSELAARGHVTSGYVASAMQPMLAAPVRILYFAIVAACLFRECGGWRDQIRGTSCHPRPPGERRSACVSKRFRGSLVGKSRRYHWLRDLFIKAKNTCIGRKIYDSRENVRGIGIGSTAREGRVLHSRRRLNPPPPNVVPIKRRK